MKRLILWLYSPTSSNPKHKQWAHPMTVVMLISFITLAIMRLAHSFVLASLDEKVVQGYEEFNWNGAIWSERVALSLMAYLATMLISRAVSLGPIHVYDGAWACNLAILAACDALFRHNRELLVAAAFMISIDQTLWYLDVICYLMRGKFLLGVAQYLTWPETSMVKKFTSTHHLWFLPLCLGLAGPSRSDLRWFLPGLIANLSTSVEPSEHHQQGALVKEGLRLRHQKIPEEIPAKAGCYYLNCNLSYACWKDVKWGSRILNKFDHHKYIYVPYQVSLWNIGNAVSYIIFLGVFSCFLIVGNFAFCLFAP
eukprot:GHVN01038320.1.p1 GENE.GHVN01038320.1~~GHVN01038320.1.p1  ORF type:complete len:311 (+),score=1.53 GHVN01038320.1:47-979(+)